MNLKTIILTALISALVAVATTVSVFAFWLYRAAHVVIIDPAESFESKTPTPTPKVEPTIPNEEVKAADVESVTIDTVYKDFFAEGSKCRQTYQEYFRNQDGVRSASSPCSVKLTINRDGSAEKTIEVRRYDTAAKQSRTVEKNVWKARLSEAQFQDLVNLIVNNEAFKKWSDNVSLYASNCKVSVRHKNGTKSPMSNVDERTTTYLAMVDAFKQLDAKTDWEKVE